MVLVQMPWAPQQLMIRALMTKGVNIRGAHTKLCSPLPNSSSLLHQKVTDPATIISIPLLLLIASHSFDVGPERNLSEIGSIRIVGRLN